jgi:hypothetical protein
VLNKTIPMDETYERQSHPGLAWPSYLGIEIGDLGTLGSPLLVCVGGLVAASAGRGRVPTKSLRMTPAMAAGINGHIWSVRELLETA